MKHRPSFISIARKTGKISATLAVVVVYIIFFNSLHHLPPLKSTIVEDTGSIRDAGQSAAHMIEERYNQKAGTDFRDFLSALDEYWHQPFLYVGFFFVLVIYILLLNYLLIK